MTALIPVGFIAASGGLNTAIAGPATWTGASTTSWSTPGNWTPLAEPDSTSDVTFPTVIPGTGSTINLSAGELASTLAFANSYSLTGGDLTLSTGTIGVTGSSASIASVLAGGGGITKTGTGTLNLSGANTYTGATALSAGITAISNATALGTAATGTNIAQGASLGLQGGITIAEPLVTNGAYNQSLLRGGTFGVATNVAELYFPTGAIGAITNLSGNNTITGTVQLAGTDSNLALPGLNTIGSAAGTLTVSGVISGGALAKVGPGTLLLSTANTFTGLVRMFQGTVIASSDNALGTAGGGVFYLAGTSTTLAFQGNVNYASAEPITFPTRGYGANGQGLIDNVSGNNTFAGTISAAAQSLGFNLYTPNSIGVTSGSLNLTGAITGSSATVTRMIQKVGTGTLILSGANSFSGPINVDAGVLALKTNGAAPGTIANRFGTTGATINVRPGAAFVIDQSGGVNTARLSAQSTVNLFGGEFGVVGEAATPSANALVGKTLGHSTLTVSTTGAATSLDATAVTRSDRQTLFVRGMADSATTTMTRVNPSYVVSGSSGTPGSTSVSIIPTIVGSASSTGTATDFVTYGTAAADSVRILAPGEYGALVSGATGTPLVNASSTGATLAANTTVNSLRLNGTTPSLDLGTKTLNVASGAVLAAQTGAQAEIKNGTLNFGGSEGILYTDTNAFPISATITGSGGLTKAGRGTVTLSTANTYTGDTYLNGGTLRVSADNQLGNAGLLHMTGGNLAATTSFTIPRDVITTAATGNAGGFDVAGSQVLTLSGVVSGAGSLSKTGAGTLVLGNTANTYVGGTSVTGGILSMSANTLGTLVDNTTTTANIVTLDGGTLQFTGNTSFPIGARAFYLGQGGATIDVTGTTQVQWTASGSGLMTGPGSLTKTGDGTWEVIGNLPNYAGGTFIKAGTFIQNNADAFPTSEGIAATTVQDTGRLFLNNIVISNVDIILANGGTLTGTGTFGTSRGFVVNGGKVDTNAATTNITGALRTSWAGNLQVTGGGTFAIARTGGGVAVTPGASITVDSGTTFNLGGTADTLSSGTNFVSVVNNSATGLNITGGTKNIGSLSGTGTTVIDGASTLVVNQQSSTSAGLITGGGALTKAGPGTLTLSAANTYAGPTTVNAGNLVLGNSDALTSTGALTIADKATVTAQLNLAKGISVLSVATAGTGKLDLTNDSLVIKSGGANANAALAAVDALVTLGYNNGDWKGPGITSSKAETDPNGLTAVGYFTNADFGATEFEGVSGLDADDVLVKYTYYGDTDLNGLVDADDFNQFLAGFQDSSLPRTWLYGDFDYNNLIDADDFNLFLATYQFNGAQLSELVSAIELSSLSAADQQTFLGAISAVPEPTSLGLLAVAAGGFAVRRRRR